MFGITKQFPSYLQGFGQDTSTVQDWISDVMKPIADVVKEYYDLQAQRVVQSASLTGISPIYLIAGGLVVWYLFRGGTKGQKVRRRKKGR